MSAILEVVVEFLAVQTAISPFPILTRERLFLPFNFGVLLIAVSCEHGSGPANLRGFRTMFASSVASDSTCVRVAKCGDDTSSYARALSVCSLHIVSEQGLANFHLVPGDKRRSRV